jgi:LysR family glycine cleavage system transcriptional activator
MTNLRRSLPLLNALVAFEAAARHGSMTRAADELHLSQSVVSRHVANLERQTGLRLFEHCAHRVTVTAEGAQLAAAIEQGLGHVRDVLDALQQEKRAPRLTLACSYDLAVLWLMPRFARVRAAMPGVELRLVTSDSYVDFDATDIDLSVRFGRGRWSGTRSSRLFGEEAFPACAPQLLEEWPALRTRPDVRTLSRVPLLALELDQAGGIDWGTWFRPHGLEAPAPIATFTSYVVLLQAALSGKGVALAWAHVMNEYLDDGRLVRLGDVSARSTSGFYLVARPNASGEVAALVECLREV